MPFCACYHDYMPVSAGLGRLRTVEGERSLLDKALDVQFGRATPLDVLGLLRNRIVVDLDPEVDECYALGPYTVFEKTQNGYGKYGDAVHKAKYQNDTNAIRAISQELLDFVQRHHRLRSVSAIAAPPKSDPSAPNLPFSWAKTISGALGVSLVPLRKHRETGPQKELTDDDDEHDVAARVSNSVTVEDSLDGANILVIDDTLRSGGTLREIGRALRLAGAQRVYGLCVAKDAKFTNGWIDLSKERWA